ncbi:MAG TPA: non-ribosomal peptide synthetase [Blastocatellia bacterium]|jgi:amino acid adenylation domain-containing protein
MSIIETVQQVCQRHPDKIAIRCAAGEMSYAEFLRRVNGLAETLRERVIGPGSRVAIHLDRSIEMIIAIFGTLSSGAAYVPLDPETPLARLQSIIEDSQPSLLLSREDGNELEEFARITCLSPDDWATEGAVFPPLDSGTAYIIYTSGSSGRPKGVVIEHASLQNYLDWALSALPFNGGGVPLLASVSFDHSITCYFPPIMKGEPLILLPPLQGGRRLAESLLTGHHYSYVKITPSHLRLLSPDQRAELGLCTDLLMFGGERLWPEVISQVRRDNPGLPIINHYGPTEATVGCCVYRVPSAAPAQAIIPIGQPIPGVEAVVRLEDGVLAKSGEAGELLIGGNALAQGYWKQPDLTADAFIYAADEQGRLCRWYRTGDIARRLDDGDIVFIGRADDQIKILGYRIEPAEVEQAILSHPKIREAVVIAAEGNDTVTLIAAVTRHDLNLSDEELRSYLRSRTLPAMIPSLIIFFDTLPITVNGKLDRQAILERFYQRESELTETTLENLLAAKFREALGVPDLQPSDDFFELGGDSLAAVEIITWANDHFQIPLETSALFENPTIESLAARIRLQSTTNN